ncbi:MAG TPA: ABC transporter [Aeromonadales bacterium]|nr:ABC transporter [Aeromonadales bacterium]
MDNDALSLKLHQKSFHNMVIIALFELIRVFKTRRGLATLAAFAVIWYFILRYPISYAAEIIQTEGFKHQVSVMFGLVGIGGLLDWQVPEMAVYWVAALYIFPFFSLLLAADQTSSDRSRGTLRFLVLRTSRDSLFFGRFLGQMLIQSIIVVLTLLATVLMASWRDPQLFTVALNSAILIFINLFIVLLPFTALMAMLSATFRSGKLATMMAIIGWGIISGLVTYLIFKFPEMKVLKDWLPGAQRMQLVRSEGWNTLHFTLVPLVQMLIFLFAGQQIMKRSSL